MDESLAAGAMVADALAHALQTEHTDLVLGRTGRALPRADPIGAVGLLDGDTLLLGTPERAADAPEPPASHDLVVVGAASAGRRYRSHRAGTPSGVTSVRRSSSTTLQCRLVT
jgi:hypothetical protein